MNYNNPRTNGSTIGIRLMCAIVFLLFSVGWLYFFQADVLAMTQHVLSGGLTHYNPVVGTVIITSCLFLLQLLVYSVLRLKGRTHALTYLPSMLLMGILTDVSLHIDNDSIHELSWYVPVIILAVWVAVVMLARMYQEVEENTSGHLFSRPMWISMLLMAMMCIGVAWIGNTNAVFHYRMMAEGRLLKGDYEGALKIGEKSQESDENLLMIRMYALARENALGERLFNYPITGSSSQVLPTDSLSRMLLYPVDSLYRFFGARPARRLPPMYYLEILQRRDSVPQKAVGDYILCSYLIDRDIDRFAKEIGKYYEVSDTLNDSLPLPRHFREALVLYTHKRSQPLLVYHEPVMDEDFDNLQELEKQYHSQKEKNAEIWGQYRGTYWYYYDYEDQ